MIWLIVVLVSVYIGIGICLPSTFTISNSFNMRGNSKDIYKRIEDFNNWNDWAIWNEDDSMLITISNPSRGVGAKYSWQSKIKEIKDGSLTLMETSEEHFLTYQFQYAKLKRGKILFNLEEKEKETVVKCSLKIDNKRKIFSRYFALFIRRSIVSNIDEVLSKIDGGLLN